MVSLLLNRFTYFVFSWGPASQERILEQAVLSFTELVVFFSYFKAVSVNQQPDFNNLMIHQWFRYSFTDGRQDIMARKELPGGTAAKAVAPPAGATDRRDFPIFSLRTCSD